MKGKRKRGGTRRTVYIKQINIFILQDPEHLPKSRKNRNPYLLPFIDTVGTQVSVVKRLPAHAVSQWFSGAALLAGRAPSHDGPICYELATRKSDSSQSQRMYVGESQNGTRRVTAHLRGHTSLRNHIERASDEGELLMYRIWPAPTKDAARQLERELLTEYDYPWNHPSR
jgi:hypothetical protein